MSNGKKKPAKKSGATGSTRATRPDEAAKKEETAAPVSETKQRSPEAKKAAVKATGTTREDRRAALRAQQLKQQQIARRNKQLKVAALVLAGIVLVGAIGWLIWANTRPKATVTPRHAVGTTGIAVYGDKAKDSARTVALYHDYQCPVCKTFEERYGQQLLDLAKNGDIKLEYHTLTFLDGAPGAAPNQSSLRSAVAAACVDAVSDKYVDYARTVYFSQPEGGVERFGFTDDQLRNDYPVKAGLTGDSLNKFQKCYDERQTKDFVDKVDSAAQKTLSGLSKDGNIGTPSLTVDGKLVDLNSLLGPDALAKPVDPSAVKLAIDATK